MSERRENGVRARTDGRGDGWAEAHRELGPQNYMQDVDGFFGMLAFAQNSAERLFVEFTADAFGNRGAIARRFAVIALFDRKRSIDAVRGEQTALSAQFYRWLCREVGTRQPKRPRFFYVVGSDAPPWTMLEVDIDTGERTELPRIIRRPDMRDIWNAIGLSALRAELAAWLLAPPRQDEEYEPPP